MMDADSPSVRPLIRGRSIFVVSGLCTFCICELVYTGFSYVRGRWLLVLIVFYVVLFR